MKRRFVFLLSLLLLPTRGEAQVRAYDLETLARLLLGGISAERVIERVRTTCVSFPLDSIAEQRLRVAGADTTVMNAVRSACYAGSTVEVNSDVPNAAVWLGGRLVGKSPYVARVNASPEPMLIEVSIGNWRDSVKTDIPAGVTVRTYFPSPEDTLPWPAVRKPMEIGEQLNLVDLWKNTRPRPELPQPASRMRRWSEWVVASAVSGSLGYVLARKGCTRTQAPYVVDSVTYPGYNLGATSSCVAAYTAPAAAVGGFLYHSVVERQRQQAVESYPERLSRWEDVQRAELERFLASHPQVKTVMATERERLDQVRDANRAAIEKNRERRAPRVAKVPTRPS